MGNTSETRRIVVKIGTDTLIRDGLFDEAYGRDVARQIAVVRSDGTEVLLVSSGAQALGNRDIAQGQATLRKGWEKSFAELGLRTDEVLFAEGDTDGAIDRVSHALGNGTIPFINGHDSHNQHIATESALQNNDIVACMLAIAFQAQLLLLTNVDGVMTQAGDVLPQVSHANQVTLFRKKSANGTGGMGTKVQSALEVASTGNKALIAHGRRPNVVVDFSRGVNGFGTRFGRV